MDKESIETVLGFLFIISYITPWLLLLRYYIKTEKNKPL